MLSREQPSWALCHRGGSCLREKGYLDRPSCGWVLVLHAAPSGEAPWFEHDLGAVSVGVMMRCTHLDPVVKAEARRRKLCRIVDELNAPVIVLSWSCVWCGSQYQGKKHCVVCGTGLYSTETSTRQMNDTRTPV